VSFSAFNNEFISGICDFPVIGDLIQAIVGDIEPTVRDGLEDFLNDPDGSGPQDAEIAKAIQNALVGIEIAGPIGAGLGVNLDAPLFNIAEDTAGITFGSNARVTAPSITTGAPNLTASYHVSQTFPTLSGTTAVGHVPYDVGICLSASAFNQLLKADTEKGLLLTDMTTIDLGGGPVPLTAGLLTPVIPQFGTLPSNTALKIHLRPTLAPIITGNNGPNGEIAELRLAQLIMEIVSGPSNNETLHIGGTIDVRTGLDLDFDDVTGQLVPTLTQPATSNITVVIIDNPIGANQATLEALLPSVISPLLPSLSDSIQSFPIPSFLGLDPNGVEVSKAGQFMSIYLDLQ
jgi:hypothetical protein